MAEHRVERSGGRGAQALEPGGGGRVAVGGEQDVVGRGAPPPAPAPGRRRQHLQAGQMGPGDARERAGARGQCSAMAARAGVGLAGSDAGEHDEGLGRGGHTTRFWASVRNAPTRGEALVAPARVGAPLERR